MVYVTSDLHGCHPAVLRRLLNKAGFTAKDELYVLGDVIDRGDHGAQLLLWMTQQPNVQLLLGNHEALLLACVFLFEEVTEESLSRLDAKQLMVLENWLQNGGGPTLAGLRRILKRDPDLLEGILEYLQEAPLYECLRVRDRKFVLVHSGLDNFQPKRPLKDYAPGEVLLARPGLDTRYFDDALVVFGHTPTAFFGEEFSGKALKTESWICIDTGAAMGGMPMLLRLDDMAEFYIDPTEM